MKLNPILAAVALAAFLSITGTVVGGEALGLDPKRPIQFDVWLDKMEVPATQKAAFGQDRKLPKFRLLGGWIDGGKVSAAYAPYMDYPYVCVNAEVNDWDLCPFGGGESRNIQLQSRFTAATLKLAGDVVSGDFALQFFDAQKTDSTLSPPCRIQVEAQRAKDGWVGRYTGQYGDYTISGPCVVVARPVLSGLHDPQNALYQILAPGAPAVFLEVRGGKVVKSAVHSAASADIVPVTVDSFSVTTQDFGLNGRGAALGGRLTLAGNNKAKPFVIALDGLTLGRAGRLGAVGYQGNSGPAQIRLDSLDNPAAARWYEHLEQLQRGMMPVPPAAAEQAVAEANTITVMPPAGVMTRYLHRLTQNNGYIYAPWCDFQPVDAAARYRYEVKQYNSRDPAVTFESDSPQASLLPVWSKMPLGEIHVRLSGLDAGGKQIGVAQERVFRHMAPLTAMRRQVDPAVALSLAMRQPHFLDQRQMGSLYITKAVMNAGMTPYIYGMQHWRFSTHLLAEEASDPVERDEYIALAEALAKRRLEDDATGPFKTAFHYHAFSCGIADHSARNLLNLIGDRPVPAVVERLGSWVRFFGRLQQPSGSWTFNTRGDLNGVGAIGMGGVHYPDQNSVSWLPFLARYRHVETDPTQRALARAMEDKALAWLRHNSLRTGYWENIWQNSPGNHWNTMQMAIEYPLYDLFRAPPANRDPVMAADVLRWQEDLWIRWNQPAQDNPRGAFTYNACYPAIMALSWLELYALTGDLLNLARSEELATRYLAQSDLVRGSDNGNIFFKGQAAHEENDANFIVRWVRRYRQLKAQPPAAIPERQLSLTLDRCIEGRDRIVLDLAVRDGRVVRALARTPTWDGPGENILQPGRLHWRTGKELFHRVDVSGLKLDATGLNGAVRLWLKEPQTEMVREVQAELKASRQWTRGWQGQWSIGKDSGRVSGLTVADCANTGPVQLAVRIADALVGGEAWQNWVSVSADPATGKAVLLNPNAGWSAETKAGDLKVGADGVSLSLETTVVWHGVAQNDFPKASGRAHCIYKTKPEDRTALLANWTMGEKHVGTVYYLGFKTDRPGDMDASAGYEYKTTHRPVTVGTYRMQLKGERLGDIVFGTAEVTGPDGKVKTSQFLGDLTTTAVKPTQPKP